MKEQTFETTSQPLPSWRLVYRELDELLRYEIYDREGDSQFWIANSSLLLRGRGAGPFDRFDALRAYRVANLEIPDGCELGPWQTGLGLFEVRALPAELHFWREVDPSSLEPSVAHYEAEHITGNDCGCCAAPSYAPRVQWDVKRRSLHPVVLAALASIELRQPELRRARLGTLKREWNAHPVGSLVFLKGAVIESGFAIADFALPRADEG